MTIYLRRGLEFRDSDLAITGEALLKQVVQSHTLEVHDSDIRVVRVRQNGTPFLLSWLMTIIMVDIPPQSLNKYTILTMVSTIDEL